MAEYIERNGAIKAVMSAKWALGSDGAVAMEIVAGAPAADVAPIRHGEWKRVSDDDQDEGWYFCSECKEEYFNPAGDDYYMLPNFCPNCGAKMNARR